MSADEVRKYTAEQAAARETLSMMLGDIENDVGEIDATCRYLVKEVMASLDEYEHDYAPEFLEAIGKIWGAAHRIRRHVERDDEPDDGAEIRSMATALARSNGKGADQ